MFKMVGTFPGWKRLRLSGSFVLQVVLSISFDEFSFLIIILHCLVALLPLPFPFLLINWYNIPLADQSSDHDSFEVFNNNF